MAEPKQNVLKTLSDTFEPGTVLFTEGEETRELYILLEGSVEVQKGGRVLTVIDQPDTYLGEMSTLLGTPRTATLVAKTPCRMVRVPEGKVAEFFQHSPSLGLKLSRTLATRLQEMNVKYERLLSEMQGKAAQEEEIFNTLTQDGYHRDFLVIYCQKVGSSMPVRDLIDNLEAPIGDLNRVLKHFGVVGLVSVEDQTVCFLEPTNPRLTRLIADWIPPEG